MWAITGASGFIGRHLVARLEHEAQPYRVLLREVRRGGSPSPEGTVYGDIRDGTALRDLVRGAEVVVHLAGFAHRSLRSAAAQAECVATNEAGTAALVDAIADVAPDAFLIFVSTASVYGPSESPIDESVQPHPANAYGTSKLAAERIVLDGRIAAAVIRPAMVFGPGAPGNLPRLISLVRRGIVVLFGNGDNRKSLVPVELLVEAIMAVARERERTRGRIFNVAGATLTMRRINEVIANASGRKPLAISLPRFVALMLGRAGEVYTSSTALDDSAIRALHSYQTDIDVEERLRNTVRSAGDPP